MKPSTTFNLASICSVLAISFSIQMVQATDAVPAVREITVSINDVYIPGGFSSESDSFVVVNGIFPNGCYRWKGGEVKHVDPLHHEIQAKALVSQGMCIMVLVPFTREIRLGRLNTGEHKLKFMNSDGTYLEKSLTIE